MRLAIFAALAVALLVGLGMVLRPAPQPVPPPPVESAAGPVEASAALAPPAPAVRRFELTAPRPAGTPLPALRVQAGETVEIVVTSVQDDELHLHGYDLAVDLRAGEPGTLRFVAEHAGRFEIELHRGHAEIAALEVAPR